MRGLAEELPVLEKQRRGENTSPLPPLKAPYLGKSCNICQTPRREDRELLDEYRGRICPRCVCAANIGAYRSDSPIKFFGRGIQKLAYPGITG